MKTCLIFDSDEERSYWSGGKGMTKNIIWLKNEINRRINRYSRFESDYAFGIADGLTEALSLIEQLDSVDNDVKLRKRMDAMQRRIDVLQKEILGR